MCRGLYITAVAISDCAMRRCSRCWCKQSRLMIPGDSSHELWCRWPTFINQRRVGEGEQSERTRLKLMFPAQLQASADFSGLPPPAVICLNCDLSVPVRAAHRDQALTRLLLLLHAIQTLMPTPARLLLIQWPLLLSLPVSSLLLCSHQQCLLLHCTTFASQKENTLI